MPINHISNWESHIERPDTDFEEYYKQFGRPKDRYTISDEDVMFYERLSDDEISRFGK